MSGPHKFNVGDSTYVVSHDQNDKLHVYERKVTKVSAKQLHVEGIGGRVIHRAIHPDSKYNAPNQWQPIVFATADEALKMYIDQCHTELARAQRRIERSNKLIIEALALLHNVKEKVAAMIKEQSS